RAGAGSRTGQEGNQKTPRCRLRDHAAVAEQKAAPQRQRIRTAVPTVQLAQRLDVLDQLAFSAAVWKTRMAAMRAGGALPVALSAPTFRYDGPDRQASRRRLCCRSLRLAGSETQGGQSCRKSSSTCSKAVRSNRSAGSSRTSRPPS